jgi:hypothetical protein
MNTTHRTYRYTDEKAIDAKLAELYAAERKLSSGNRLVNQIRTATIGFNQY